MRHAPYDARQPPTPAAAKLTVLAHDSFRPAPPRQKSPYLAPVPATAGARCAGAGSGAPGARTALPRRPLPRAPVAAFPSRRGTTAFWSPTDKAGRAADRRRHLSRTLHTFAARRDRTARAGGRRGGAARFDRSLAPGTLASPASGARRFPSGHGRPVLLHPGWPPALGVDDRETGGGAPRGNSACGRRARTRPPRAPGASDGRALRPERTDRAGGDGQRRTAGPSAPCGTNAATVREAAEEARVTPARPGQLHLRPGDRLRDDGKAPSWRCGSPAPQEVHEDPIPFDGGAEDATPLTGAPRSSSRRAGPVRAVPRTRCAPPAASA